jgi:hypothetical protein
MQVLGDLANERRVRGFRVGGADKDRDRCESLPVYILRLKDRNDVVSDGFYFLRPAGFSVKQREFERNERRVIAHALCGELASGVRE